jgi:serine/threonine-protein kinase
MDGGRRQEEGQEAWAGYAPGDLIAGKYELESRIGAGSMGTVWIASHQELGARVAIKLMRSDLYPSGMHPLLAERLVREARAAARIHHPAIVRVFDFGVSTRGDPFIAMELLRGEGLRAALQRQRRFTPERAVALVLPIASGLDAAHARGVIHRDLKPDNILLATDDSARVQPKLVDFGVAKLSFLGPHARPLTGVALIGTPEYMAPEQALALAEIDERVDIWSLCVCLYELIAGRVPFPGATFEEVLRPIVQDEPASLVERAGVDGELWAIIEQGLSKSPANRQPSMRELGEQLAGWLQRRGIGEDVAGGSLLRQWGAAAPFPVLHAPATAAPRQTQPTAVWPLVRRAASPRARRQSRRKLGALAVALVAGSLLLGGSAMQGSSPVQARSGPAPLPARAMAHAPIPQPASLPEPPGPKLPAQNDSAPEKAAASTRPEASQAPRPRARPLSSLVPAFHASAPNLSAPPALPEPDGAAPLESAGDDDPYWEESQDDGTDDACPYGCVPPVVDGGTPAREPNPYDDEELEPTELD